MGQNSLRSIRIYFENATKPLGNTEFRDFWYSLTEDEKEYYRNVDLVTGLMFT